MWSRSHLLGHRTCSPAYQTLTRGEELLKSQAYQEIGPMPNFLIPGSAEILLRKTAGAVKLKILCSRRRSPVGLLGHVEIIHAPS